jgi:type I restriction enzyme, S subunit
MTFPPYKKYKDTGRAYLGAVPEHWELCALKQVALLRSGDAITAEQIEVEGEFPVFGGNGQRGYTTSYTHDGLFVLIGRQGALCGNINYASGKFWASEHAVVASPVRRYETRWLGELLRAMNLNQYSLSAAQPGLSVDVISNLQIPVPPITEQSAIAAFLDIATAKIDALVNEQARLIVLLREKRQSVISHAVSKGLNPSVRMRDSGVEWLGEIPEQWTLQRLKHISPSITVGIVVNPSDYVAADGLPFLYGGDIGEGRIQIDGARRISSGDSERNAKTRLSAGDLVTVRVGAPGVTAVVPISCEGGNCASVMLTRKGSFASQWLCYAMNSRVVRYQVELVQYGAAQEQFNISHAVNFWVPTPSTEEQRSISTFLDAQTSKIDELVAEVEAAIALLQERRSVLISSAVTGKIDVRGLVPIKAEAA